MTAEQLLLIRRLAVDAFELAEANPELFEAALRASKHFAEEYLPRAKQWFFHWASKEIDRPSALVEALDIEFPELPTLKTEGQTLLPGVPGMQYRITETGPELVAVSLNADKTEPTDPQTTETEVIK